MKRVIATLAVTLAVAAAGAGAAFAGTPVQSSTQSATTDQAALAASDAVQVDPSNENLVVRVLSPGTDGSVTQTNNAASSGTSGNTATTSQTAGQTQAASCGCAVSPTTMTDAAQNGDPAGVLAGATQLAPATTAAPAGVQSSDQSASTDQSSLAASSAAQVDPSNQNIDVRVLSPRGQRHRLADEQRRLVGDVGQHRHDHADRRPEPKRRLRRAVVGAARRHRPAVGRAL
jgi:hypothetical protein